MASPHKNASSGGCFSGIARLLLCKGSLQTHPSDQLTDFLHRNNDDRNRFEPSRTDRKVKIEANVVQGATGPGVVARLMGLESLPDTNWVPKGRSLDSLPRSRSVNFMDYFHELDLERARHRRARTSFSFREDPTLLNQENNEWFVVYLDNQEKNKKQRKSEFGLEDVKQKNEVKDKNHERLTKKYEKKLVNYNKVSNTRDRPRKVLDRNVSNCKRGRRVSSPDHKKELRRRKLRENSSSKRLANPLKSINQKEELTESKLMKKIKNRQAVKDTQFYWSSEDSSPVSVLTLGDFSVDEPTPILPDYRRSADSSSMKKGSSTTSSSTAFQLSHPAHTSSKDNEQFENTNDSSYYIELVANLCWLTEKELRMSNCIVKHSALEFEFWEEMCMEFEQQILDVLLLQIVEELAE